MYRTHLKTLQVFFIFLKKSKKIGKKTKGDGMTVVMYSQDVKVSQR